MDKEPKELSTNQSRENLGRAMTGKGDFKAGDRVYITAGHPWADTLARLLSYGTYGYANQLTGWLCRNDDGMEFYAQSHELKKVGLGRGR